MGHDRCYALSRQSTRERYLLEQYLLLFAEFSAKVDITDPNVSKLDRNTN